VFDDIDMSLLKDMPIMIDLKDFSEMAVRIVQLLDSLTHATASFLLRGAFGGASPEIFRQK